MPWNPEFERYLAESVGKETAASVCMALEGEPSVSVRFNPYKCTPGEKLAWEADSVVPWNEHAVFIKERPVFTLDPLFHGGVYYVQDSSAMYPGRVFRDIFTKENHCTCRERAIRILDLCAAPGGKTTDLAASARELFGDNFLLVSNEVMQKRVTVLSDNVEAWGDPAVIVTSVDPAAFARLEGFFDIIVTDVPCSGEGMFRKDSVAAESWSEDNVALCQARQRRIVSDVWPALAAGGYLIYSTCTFNRRENDDNVEWIASTLGGEPARLYIDCAGPVSTDLGVSLLPGLVRGEGQYCALIRKSGGLFRPEDNLSGHSAGSEYRSESNSHTDIEIKGLKAEEAMSKAGRLWRSSGRAMRKEDNYKRGQVDAGRICDIAASFFREKMRFKIAGDTLAAIPERIAAEVSALESIHPLRWGCTVGKLVGGGIVPDTGLAQCIMFERKAFPEAELSLQQALSYLRKESLSLPEVPKGFVTVTYGGHPLGFVKNIGNRCNNLYSSGRRIRMNIH